MNIFQSNRVFKPQRYDKKSILYFTRIFVCFWPITVTGHLNGWALKWQTVVSHNIIANLLVQLVLFGTGWSSWCVWVLCSAIRAIRCRFMNFMIYIYGLKLFYRTLAGIYIYVCVCVVIYIQYTITQIAFTRLNYDSTVTEICMMNVWCMNVWYYSKFTILQLTCYVSLIVEVFMHIWKIGSCVCTFGDRSLCIARIGPVYFLQYNNSPIFYRNQRKSR